MVIKNYIWDFDGTLYDTYPAMVAAVEKALQHLGIRQSKEQIYRMMKQESLDYLKCHFEVAAADFDPLFKKYEEQSSQISRPFAETSRVLNQLATEGCRHFILTHRTTASTEALLKRDRLAALITTLIGSDSGFPRKPAPDSIQYLLNSFQLLPEETLMIGDRRLDIEAGRNADVKTCLYDRDGFLGAIPADHQIKTLAEILCFH